MVAGLAVANLVYFLWTQEVAPAPAVPAAAAVDTLHLASEMHGAPPAAPAEPSGLAATDATSSGEGTPVGDATSGGEAPSGGDRAVLLTDVKRCLSVGPFRDVAEAAHAERTLRAGGYDPRQRVVDGDVWAGVWVYLPAPADPAAEEQLLARLKAAGFEDALEMPGPVEGSVISLGLFSDQKRAQSRVTQAQALGLNPALADRKRTGNVYWVDVDLKPTDGALNPADLQAEAGRISRLETKACPAAPPS
jgi:hypothetical protein